MVKNNITRLLDAQKIQYMAYELPAEKLGAQETAQILNLPAEQVFKTIVVRREGKGKPILAMVSGACEVDLKALAKAVGEKKLHLPTEREAEQITGMQAGGISPLALVNRGFQMVLDSSASAYCINTESPYTSPMGKAVVGVVGVSSACNRNFPLPSNTRSKSCRIRVLTRKARL